MKLKKVDYEISEELYSVNCVLQMLMQQYEGKIPNDVMESIEKAIILADRHLGKEFIPKMDIIDMKLVFVAFDMDTIKDLENIKNKQ